MQRLTAQARHCSDVVTRGSRPQSGGAACIVPTLCSHVRHAAAAAAAAAAATPRQQARQRHGVARQQNPTQRHQCRMQIATAAAAAAVDGASSSSALEVADDEEEEVSATAAVNSIVQYALSLAQVSQAYEVHSWVLLLGILKLERCTAAKLLQKLGLEDLYGAWNEVLWAINACDGLKPKAVTHKVGFTDKAFKVMNVSMYYASCAGRTVVQTEDLLLALAAGDVLLALFPDLNLTADRVRAAIEQYTETTYVFDGEEADGASSGDESIKADESIFL